MDFRALSKLRSNPREIREIASTILRRQDISLTMKEVEFLKQMSRFEGPNTLSTRAGEWLYDLNLRGLSYSAIFGFSIQKLISTTYLARFDLEEDDEDFVVSLQEQRPDKLTKRQARWLIKCAQQVGVLEGYVDLPA